ncbi:MAG TPA: histidine kinase, partial [Burkholderiaceae bacterium]
ADIDLGTRRLVFGGVGNIGARLLTGTQDRSLLSQHGTIGLRVRQFEETRYDVPLHAVLVMHSDGIVARWTLKDTPELLSCEAIVIAAFLIRDHLRGRDDATVVVVRVH